MHCHRKLKWAIYLIFAQIVFTCLFAVFGEYAPSANTKRASSLQGGNQIDSFYPGFQDVHVMIFVGFGFLMTFLKRYGFSAVSLNLLVAAFVIQWATIVRGVIHMIQHGEGKFTFHIGELLTADFAAATVLISFGAVLGKTSPLQLLVMSTLEVIFSQINEHVGFTFLEVTDVGESIFIHAFGAYFGLAVARVLFKRDASESTKEGSVYHSDVFSMIGTIFLWIYWPSFNGGGVEGDQRHRAIINTYFSLAACTIVTFAISALVHKKGKIDMVHIQNATLAGGVAVGTTANLMINAWGAMLLGSAAGLISVIGYRYISPVLSSKLKIHDTCGVNNLHGMPGILAGIGGAIVAALATTDDYGDTLYDYFPARTPTNTTGTLEEGRSAALQGGFQVLALVMTLGVAMIGGAITGAILKLPIWDNPKGEALFDDGEFFEVPDHGYPPVFVDANGEMREGIKYHDDPNSVV